nr:putative ribonuclease H-like domain-containing protein [Tanacetum cinerariifolium]
MKTNTTLSPCDGPKTIKSVCEDIFNEVKEYPDAPLVKEMVSDNKDCSVESPVVANCNYHQRKRVVTGNNYTRVYSNHSTRKTHPSAHRNMALRAVLIKTDLRPFNTARPVNTAHPKTTVNITRPLSRAVNNARPNSAIVNVVRENQVNDVKASACWVWRPTKPNGASITLKRHNYIDGHQQKDDQGYVDSGCSRHMTENMSYLSNFKEFDSRYVIFGGGANGGRITANKNETTSIIKKCITEIENLVDKKVKVIRCDNGTEFKNSVMNDFCAMKGIRREFRVARTPQQNDVVERRNKTLIKAAKTMLADSKLPTTF